MPRRRAQAALTRSDSALGCWQEGSGGWGARRRRRVSRGLRGPAADVFIPTSPRWSASAVCERVSVSVCMSVCVHVCVPECACVLFRVCLIH